MRIIWRVDVPRIVVDGVSDVRKLSDQALIARVRPPMYQATIPGSGVEPKVQTRCCVCNRAIYSKWALLGIGPTCAKKRPKLAVALLALRHLPPGDYSIDSSPYPVDDNNH